MSAVRINLLPHREEKRKRRQQQFVVLSGFFGAMAFIIAVLIYVVLLSRLDYHQHRNNYSKGEIAKLDAQIEEIQKIREETQALLSKKQVVEGLQSNRSESVYLMDQMLRQLPEGLYLRSIRQKGAKVNVTGLSQSNARVSAFMRNIQASPYLKDPELVEIKANTINNQRVSEFSLNFSMKRPEGENADSLSNGKEGAAKKGGATSGKDKKDAAGNQKAGGKKP